ncbi:MAG: aminodeoxychorismate lyase [Steroidobacteraceae bacterium]
MAAPKVILVNGRAWAEVSALDRGLHYGDGLFETIACTAGHARLLELHLERLAEGCRRLGIAPPDTVGLRGEISALAAPAARAVIKLLVTRGTALARGYAVSGTETANRILLRYAWPAEDPQLAMTGVRVRTATTCLGENPALAGLKHCNRLEQVLARREWTDPAIADSLMYTSDGTLVSGTMSNVFMVRNARLQTPRVDRCGVAGVMRRAVLQVAAATGLAAQECTLRAADLASAEEIFVTNALIGVRPVRELDGIPRRPGPVTRALQAGLARRFAADAAGA